MSISQYRCVRNGNFKNCAAFYDLSKEGWRSERMKAHECRKYRHTNNPIMCVESFGGSAQLAVSTETEEPKGNMRMLMRSSRLTAAISLAELSL